MPTPPPLSSLADPPNDTTVAGRPPAGGEGSHDGDRHRDGASTGHPTRREFAARAVTALAALSALGASGLGACAHPGTGVASPPSPLSPTPIEPLGADAAGSTARTVAGGDLTDALCAAVDARYGARLEADERAHVRDAIGRTVRLSDALRQHRVPNDVDPFSSFHHPAAGRGGTGDGRDA